MERLVERPRRAQIVTKWLLDDDRRPLRQPSRTQGVDQRLERRRRHGEICDAPVAAEMCTQRCQVAVRDRDEVQPLREGIESRRIDSRSRELGDTVARVVTKTLIVPRERGGADDVPFRGQQMLDAQVVQRRQKLAMCEVSGGADDHDVLIGRRAQRRHIVLWSLYRYLPLK